MGRLDLKDEKFLCPDAVLRLMACSPSFCEAGRKCVWLTKHQSVSIVVGPHDTANQLQKRKPLRHTLQPNQLVVRNSGFHSGNLSQDLCAMSANGRDLHGVAHKNVNFDLYKLRTHTFLNFF